MGGEGVRLPAVVRDRVEVWTRERTRALAALLGLLTMVLLAPSAAAQPGLRALDAVWLTPRLLPASDTLSLAASAGHGAMGQVAGSGGSHQRASGAVAVGLSSRLGLAAELRLDGRWDVHDVPGGDDSLVGDPRFLARYARAVARWARAGLELTVWTPGRSAPSFALSATSVDLLLATELRLRERLALDVALGPRFDRSAHSVERSLSLSRSDTLALGVSSYHALLLRVALSAQLRATTLAGELSADLLLGVGAPRAWDSPVRAALQARHRLTKRVELSGTLSLLLSGRAPFREERHVPYEPRVAGFLGIRYQLEPAPAPRPQAKRTPPPAPAAPPAPAPQLGTLLVQVSDEQGEPLPDVRVVIRDGAEQYTGGAGRTLFEEIVPGERVVEVGAPGFASQEHGFTASGELPAELSVTLLAERQDSVLRVQVRDAQSGGALAAECTLSPAKGKGAAQRFVTDAAGGHELALPAGRYRVTVQAAGYVTQSRALAVKEQGVTLFNIDLTPGAP